MILYYSPWAPCLLIPRHMRIHVILYVLCSTLGNPSSISFPIRGPCCRPAIAISNSPGVSFSNQCEMPYLHIPTCSLHHTYIPGFGSHAAGVIGNVERHQLDMQAEYHCCQSQIPQIRVDSTNLRSRAAGTSEFQPSATLPLPSTVNSRIPLEKSGCG